MDNQFIEIKRVVSNRETKVNITSQLEAIDIADIETFRAWHKGPNDMKIDGDMTLIILRNRDTAEFSVDNVGEVVEVEEKVKVAKKVRTILIQESYKSFINRMSVHRVVRRME